MKKFLTILLACVLCVCCFGLVGCGVEGTYNLVAVEIDGEVYEPGDMIELTRKYGRESMEYEFDEWVLIVETEAEINISTFRLEAGGDAKIFNWESIDDWGDVDFEWDKKDNTIEIETNHYDLRDFDLKFDVKGRKLRLDISEIAAEELDIKEEIVLIYKRA